MPSLNWISDWRRAGSYAATATKSARAGRLGLCPLTIGASALADRSKAALLGAYMGINAGIKRMSGRGVRDNMLAYAPTGKVPA